MPRYLFEIAGGPDGDEPISRKLHDLNTARREAARTLGVMIADAGGDLRVDSALGITVRDPSGVVLYSVRVEVREPPAVCVGEGQADRLPKMTAWTASTHA